MQSSQDRNGDDSARSLDGSMRGRIFLYCQVRAHLIVIRRISGKNSPQVRLAEDEYLIQALAAQCADQTFGTTILPRRPRRDRSIADTHRPHPRREDVSIGAVVVAHQVGWRRGPGECLGDLPSQPLGCRLPCHLEPQQLSPAMPQKPRMQTRDQRSASAQRTHRWQQSPQRDSAEKSSRVATAASKVAPYISRPWTEPPQSQASEARHESWMRPKVGFLYSSAG